MLGRPVGRELPPAGRNGQKRVDFGANFAVSAAGGQLSAGRSMTADTPFRDISSGPAEAAPARLRRPDRDAPYRPVDDDHPLLAAHGGVLTVERLGTVAYRPAWELQDELADQRRGRRIGDRLLLVEHFPVYTIGRGGDASNMLASPERLRELRAELI